MSGILGIGGTFRRAVAAGIALALATGPIGAQGARPTATPALPVAAKGKQVFSGEYTVYYIGLPVARSSFVSTFNGNRFNIRGTVSSAGLAKIFDSTTGTSNVAGSFVGGQTRTDSFRVQYKSGKKTQTTAITFAGNRVAKTVNVPPLRKRANWVPLKPADLVAVTDPIAATLIRADSPAQVCRRTLKVYDGQLRANLALSYVSTGRVSGFDGEAVSCSARFVPVSGYRTTNRSIAFLRDKARITVSFARLGETGIYAPVRASVSTTIGTVTMAVKRTKQ